MIDFACKQFDVEEIIRCGFGLTKAEYHLILYFLKHAEKACDTLALCRGTKLNRTTIQKAVKRFYEKGLVNRHQKNLSSGGYLFTYQIKNKKELRVILKNLIRAWSEKVEREIDRW